MDKVDVSVVLAVYNAEEYLLICLNSLLVQTLKNIEFIIIDDYSTDTSYSLIKEFLDKHPAFAQSCQLHRMEKNSGISIVRNRGLQLARGNYIGWIDSDDWVEEFYFEKLYLKAVADDADIVWTDYHLIDKESKRFVSQASEEDQNIYIEGMIRGELLGVVWNKLYKKTLFMLYQVRFPDHLNMCEDLRVNVELFFHALKISYVPDGGYYHTKYNLNSISSQALTIPCVNQEWIDNVGFVVSFIEANIPSIDRQFLDLFKLEPKRNLIVKGQTLECFKAWKEIFPEANYSIKYSDYPMYYKVLAICIQNNLWFIVKYWIFLKYKIIR